MATIKATAHLNELTAEVKNDYFLLPQVTATLREDDIIQRLEAKEIATKNVNGKAFVRAFQEECALALSEGYNVVTYLFHATVGIKGVVLAPQLGHNIPAGELNVGVRFTQGVGAREALAQATVHVAEQPAPTGPVIQSVTDPTVGKTDTVTAGGMVLIQGIRLAVKGDAEHESEIGVFFACNDGRQPIRIPASQLSPNTATKLQFALPAAISAGNEQWTVSVATQATGAAHTFTKEVRRYDYQGVITVE
ncbi:hypothetical protein FACS189452_04670 [Bacteroidia bacterium]|nr:hypothetical protein FACS189452_04670 [Bacteroidia bacterium]